MRAIDPRRFDLGGIADLLKVSSAPACARLVKYDKLSEVSDVAGEDMQRTRTNIAAEVIVGKEGLAEDIASLAKGCKASQDIRLDLIAHSTGSACLLKLSEWVIDDSQATKDFFAKLAADLRTLRVKHIRLLGCGTATKGGWKAMAAVHQAVNPAGAATQIGVWGAKTELHSHYYNKSGFLNSKTDKLEQYDSTKKTPVLKLASFVAPFVRLDRGRLVAGAQREATILRGRWVHAVSRLPWDRVPEFLRLIDPLRGKPLRLFLGEPVTTVVLPSPAPGRRALRADVLLQNRLIRLFPSDYPEGLYFEVPIDLEAELRELLAVTVPVPP